MIRIALLFSVVLAGISILSGCSEKTPEEIEAAKYPKVKPNTPEEEKAMRERLGIGKPTTP